MKSKKYILNRIKEDARIKVPDVWDKIKKGDQVDVEPVKLKRKRSSVLKKISAIAACFIVLIVAGKVIFPNMSLPNMKKNVNDGMMLSPPTRKELIKANSEEYSEITENKFIPVKENSISTFSIDVDTASYGIIRQHINSGLTVPTEAVRIEEMVNYFKYDYPKPTGEHPFSVYTELAKCPWNTKNNLLLIGLQSKEVELKDLPTSNLVFLIDVSGSMSDANKLPLVKKAFNLLIENLRENDRISIVTYAGSESIVLQGEYGDNKIKIGEAIEKLESGGSTAGAQGIETAYKIAKQYFIEGGNNRVILATDGDFNVGVSSESELKTLIENKRNDNIYLSVIGFGTGNIKDNKMETLSQYGNGNYSYVDSELEAKKVLVEEMGGTLLTIAKDVKLQLEFYKEKVKAYRLIGYENRILNSQDFADDTKDAGEMGAGHRVTAIYELIPEDGSETAKSDWCKIDIRYKNPTEDTSKLLSVPVNDGIFSGKMSDNFAFASSVSEFGLLLKNSLYKGNSSYKNAYDRIKDLQNINNDQYKMEFLEILRKFAD